MHDEGEKSGQVSVSFYVCPNIHQEELMKNQFESQVG
jgi:hypothetical protein